VEEIAAARPDVIVAMPCGWDARRARAEVESHSDRIAAIGAERIWAVDGAASFSRPGPRLVDGTELLAHLLHPDRVEAPAVDARAPRSREGAPPGATRVVSKQRPVRWERVPAAEPAGQRF
jgi:hypothetical protein